MQRHHPKPTARQGSPPVPYTLWAGTVRHVSTICVSCGVGSLPDKTSVAQLLAATDLLLSPWFCLFQKVVDLEPYRREPFRPASTPPQYALQGPPSLLLATTVTSRTLS